MRSLLKINLLTVLLLAFSAPLAAQADDFQTDASQAILIDLNTDTVLFEKNSDEHMFPSSMTKVLTMYLVFDQLKKNNINMDTIYTVSHKAWKTGGSQMFLEVGKQVKVSDLVQGVIVQSGNDACVTLAEGISGSEAAFVTEMNETAKNLGAVNTHFSNSNGLPTEDHYTTARDLSLISRRLITDFPEYYHYFSQREYTFNNITQQNRDKLLNIPDLGVDGIKTGYTELGGYGIISSAVKDGRRLISVVNGLKSVNARLESAEALLRYGFNNFKDVKLFNKFEIIEKVKVWAGEQDYVPVAPNKDVALLLSKKDFNQKSYKSEIAYKEPWVAPIKKGDQVATLAVKDGDKILAQFPLYATEDVAEASFMKKMMQKINYMVERKF